MTPLREGPGTPLPWRLCAAGSNFAKGKLFIRPNNGEALIATVSGERKTTENRANAAYIVKVANLFPELVAAAVKAVESCGCGLPKPSTVGGLIEYAAQDPTSARTLCYGCISLLAVLARVDGESQGEK